MKLLYGVQATGQGHISRARAMARALADHPVTVTWLFSGRPRENLFDMSAFGDYEYRRGLTFASRSGRISYLHTLATNDTGRFLRDVRQLDLSGYDGIVTDFEPVTAWAARRAGVPSIGIGHQYAFGPGSPMRGDNPLTRLIMSGFAPVRTTLGLHWHPYADNVLPPILDLPPIPVSDSGHFVVYLPFEDQERVTRLLETFAGTRFVQYAAGLPRAVYSNVSLNPLDTVAFKRDLAASAGVICNSGFELISECLQWRKPVLTKPLRGQPEQLSNAQALRELGYATVTDTLTPETLACFLQRPKLPPAGGFNDVAAAIAGWLANGCRETPAELSARLWRSHGVVHSAQKITSMPSAKTPAGLPRLSGFS